MKITGRTRGALAQLRFLIVVKKSFQDGDTAVYACYSSVCPVDNNSVGAKRRKPVAADAEKVVEKVANAAMVVAV
jgi:hypothetical protein